MTGNGIRDELTTINGTDLDPLAGFVQRHENGTVDRDTVMSVAWPQKTVKGLGPPGGPESTDPYTESGERRARFLFAAVGSCKTPMRGFKSHRRLLNERQRESSCKGLLESGRPLCVFRESV